MTRLPWLADWTGTSIDDLLALEGAYRTDSLVCALESALLRKPRSRLTRTERIVLAVEALEREVNDGGFRQFLGNSSVEWAAEAAPALDAIGCPRTAAVVRSALAELGIAGAVTPQSVEKALREAGGALGTSSSACDDAFLRQPEDVCGALFAYVRTHRADVGWTSPSGAALAKSGNPPSERKPR